MELLLYNGILSLPVLLIIILGTGEVWVSLESMMRQSRESLAFLPLLFASLLMGSLLNYCLFLCTLCNSALTTTIVGTLRSVLGTVSLLSSLSSPFILSIRLVMSYGSKFKCLMAQNLNACVIYDLCELTNMLPTSGYGVFRIWWSKRNDFHLLGSSIQHIRWRLVHINQVQGEARQGKAVEGAI